MVEHLSVFYKSRYTENRLTLSFVLSNLSPPAQDKKENKDSKCTRAAKGLKSFGKTMVWFSGRGSQRDESWADIVVLDLKI